jgi:hypothetical protein
MPAFAVARRYKSLSGHPAEAAKVAAAIRRWMSAGFAMKHCPNPDCENFTRFGRVGEFVDATLVCSDCGSALALGEATQPEPPSFRELVTIYKAADGIQAHLVRGVLEGEGIPVSIRGEALMGALGELPATMLDVEVQVPPEFASRARELALDCEEAAPEQEAAVS